MYEDAYMANPMPGSRSISGLIVISCI